MIVKSVMTEAHTSACKEVGEGPKMYNNVLVC